MTDAGRASPEDYSVTATMPWKLLRSRHAIVDGRVVPAHIRIYPTDICNAHCSFCCARRSVRGGEMPLDEIREMVRHFHDLGTRAITISGGGEPTTYSGLEALLDLCGELDIAAGILTNGIAWGNREKPVFADGRLAWARISLDVRDEPTILDRVRIFSANLPNVRTGLYMVATENLPLDMARRMAELAETLPNVTHVKFVPDTTTGDESGLTRLENAFGRDFGKVIFHYNGASAYDVAEECPCFYSVLKPTIGADGNVYSCSRYEYLAPMMHWRDFGPDAAPFAGGDDCRRCMWGTYNRTVKKLLHPGADELFI